MALITCPECNNEISDLAEKCPHCGYNAQSQDLQYTDINDSKSSKKQLKKKSSKKTLFLMILVICVFGVVLFAVYKSTLTTKLTEDSIVGIWQGDLGDNIVFAKSNRGYTYRYYLGDIEDHYLLFDGTYIISKNKITAYHSNDNNEMDTFIFDAKNNCISTSKNKFYKIENSESTAESINEKVSRFEYSGSWYCYTPSIPSTPYHYLHIDSSGVIYCSFNSSETPSNFSGFDEKYKLTYPDNYSVEPYNFSTDTIVMHATQKGLGVNNWTLTFNRSSANEITMKLNCDRMTELPSTGDYDIWNKIEN